MRILLASLILLVAWMPRGFMLDPTGETAIATCPHQAARTGLDKIRANNSSPPEQQHGAPQENQDDTSFTCFLNSLSALVILMAPVGKTIVASVSTLCVNERWQNIEFSFEPVWHYIHARAPPF